MRTYVWNGHINDIAIKLNRVNAVLYRVREFVNKMVLKLIYHAFFNFHLSYANTVCGQNKNSLSRLFLLQTKASELLVLKVQMLLLTLFSIGMKS